MKKKTRQNLEDKKFPLPVYKKEDDIYNKEEEVPLDEEGQQVKKKPVNSDETADNDLDVPGAELDNANEAIGEEDEENNYYSLGGDNHENLEEDKGS